MAEALLISKATEVAGKIVDNLVQSIWTLVSTPFILVYNWKDNVAKLDDQLEALKNEQREVELSMEEFERKGQASSTHQNWLTKTDEVILPLTKDEELKMKREKAKMKSFCGLCPNPLTLYKVSKRAKENAESIDVHVQEAIKKFNLHTSHDLVPRERVAGSPVPGFQDFPSRKDVLENIMAELRSARVNRIGLHGMAGAGKSMMVKEVRRRAEEEKVFERVVLVKVTVKPDLKRIRDELARGLGMTQLAVELTSRQVTDKIKAKLQILAEKGKVLFILDDVWEKIDLEEIGISFPETDQSGEECFKWKIFFTSRDRNVFSDMVSKQVFTIGKIKPVEAKNMFVEIAGKEILTGGELESTALQIIEECGRLPLAIATLAHALRGRDLSEWRSALTKLKSPSPHNFSGVSKSIYAATEMSYNQLESKELKQIFLLSGMLGPNFSLESLLKYGIGFGLFPQANTMEQAHEELLTLINHLKAASLLIDGSDGGGNSFYMHDITCDVAISIARKDHEGLLLKDNHEPQEWHHMEAIKCFKWILLQNSDVSELPEDFESSDLDLVFFGMLNKDRCCLEIPDKFFKGMSKLRVLHLCQMDHLSPLPSSIGFLKNLHTLSLEQSELEEGLSYIGELKSLEILSLSRSNFVSLPEEIRQLTRLKSLDLSNCDKLKVIPPHVLGKLSKLEELYLANSFVQWDYEEHCGGDDQQRASLVELKNLKRLVVLEVCIGDIQMIPTGLLFENLKKYKIFIGKTAETNHVDDYFDSSRMVKLQLNASPNVDYSVKEQLFNKTEELYLEGMSHVENVIDELYDEGFQHLKYLSVKKAPDVRHIIYSAEMFPLNAFPALEELFLHKLVRLDTVFQGWISKNSLTKLTKITVGFCKRLQNLFSSSIARQLVQLQHIDVQHCDEMKEIVDDDGEEEVGRYAIVAAETSSSKSPEFGEQLRSLRLQHLPKLIGFSRSCDSLSLFNDKVVNSRMEELMLFSIQVRTIWSISSSFSVSSLVNLKIEGCNELEYLFSLSMARDLENLRFLRIRDCKKMQKVIFSQNGEEEGGKKKLSFLKLESLYMSGLPELVGFYEGSCGVEFPSLKELNISNSHKMKGFIINGMPTDEEDALFFNGQVEFPILESMCLNDLGCLTMIWDYQNFKTRFGNLKKLLVFYCHNLKTVFPSINMLETSLEEIAIFRCNSVQVVFEISELNVVQSNQGRVDQVQLKRMNIEELPSLEHVWNFRDSQVMISFPNLENVVVRECPRIKHVFPESIAVNLLQLQELYLFADTRMEEIVASGSDPGEVVKFEFPQLTSLTLGELLSLNCFYPGKHLIVWPMLKELYYVRTFVSSKKRQTDDESGKLDFPMDLPLFPLKQVIRRLRKLSLSEKDIKMISRSQFKGDPFSNIKHLSIHNYEFQPSLVLPIRFLQKFCSLEKLDVVNSMFSELFPSKGGHAVKFSKIKKLKLSILPKLIHIWSQDSSNALPNLEDLEVFKCERLISLSEASSKLSFWGNLTNLDVSYCKKMMNLFSPSTAQNLTQLQDMTITFCVGLTEVVENEEDGTQESAIIFQKLRYLKLKGLTRLASFCSGKNVKFEFPSLKQVIVEQCPNLRIFYEGDLTTPELRGVVSNEVENNSQWSSDLNTTLQNMFTKEVGYGGLTDLELSAFPKMIENWHNENLHKKLDFGRLHHLELCNCNNLSFLLTPAMALKLESLKKLVVENCGEMEQVVKGAQDQVVIFKQLQDIELMRCSNLTSFYVGSDNGLEFPDLFSFYAQDCPNMVTFAHFVGEASQAQGFFGNKVVLPLIKTLQLDEMLGMKKIWEDDQLDAESFKQLNSVVVRGCSNLSNIFPIGMVERLPELKCVRVSSCGLLGEIFESQPGSQDQMILPAELDFIYLSNLPILKRFCSGNSLRLSSLKELRIQYCPLFEEISSSNPSVSQDFPAHNISDKEETFRLFGAKVAFPNLEILEINMMKSLKKIWDAEVDANSFCKLNQLFVLNCENLEHIFPSSMLENGNLQSLGILQISKCSSIKDIIGASSEETILKIALPSLSEVKLKKLPQLQCFCSSNRKFEFPTLKDVMVIGCPRIEFFSKQESLTPKLQSVKWMKNEDDEGIWKGDLNATIQEMFTQKVGYSILKKLNLSEYQELIPIWNQNPHQGILRFKMLTLLEVCNLDNLRYALTPSMALSLEQLKEFRVVNCEAIEQVIADNEEGYQEMMLCPKMEILKLQDLPTLTRFASGNSFEFPSLTQLAISKCPLLKTFISSNTSQDLTVSSGTVDALFDAKVAFPMLKKLIIMFMESLNKIWDDQLDDNSFCQLDIVIVDSCHKLSYIFPFSMVGRLQTLDTLEIWSCDSLVEIFGYNQSQSGMEFVFPKLTWMSLRLLPELKCFFPQIHTIECPSMTKLEVNRCDQIQILASEFQEDNQLEIFAKCSLFWVTEDTFPVLEELNLDGSKSMEQIWCGGDRPRQYFPQLRNLKHDNLDEELQVQPFISALNNS